MSGNSRTTKNIRRSGLNRINYQKNPNKYRGYTIKTKYGINLDAYRALCEAQNGICKICGKPPETGKKLFIDHDHRTGRVRGLLCRSCNFGLGFFGDNPAYLTKAVKYLEE